MTMTELIGTLESEGWRFQAREGHVQVRVPAPRPARADELLLELSGRRGSAARAVRPARDPRLPADAASRGARPDVPGPDQEHAGRARPPHLLTSRPRQRGSSPISKSAGGVAASRAATFDCSSAGGARSSNTMSFTNASRRGS